METMERFQSNRLCKEYNYLSYPIILLIGLSLQTLCSLRQARRLW